MERSNYRLYKSEEERQKRLNKIVDDVREQLGFYTVKEEKQNERLTKIMMSCLTVIIIGFMVVWEINTTSVKESMKTAAVEVGKMSRQEQNELMRWIYIRTDTLAPKQWRK